MFFQKCTFISPLLALLLAGPGAVWSQPVNPGPPATAVVQPERQNSVLGFWSFMVPGAPDGLCQETYRYLENGSSQESSGNSVTNSQWRVDPKVDSSGFSTMSLRILQHNGQRDCSNVMPPVGNDFNILVRVHPTRNWMEFCSVATERRSCIVLWRLLER